MARVKRGVQARRRHKKILKLAKGYYGARSRVFRVAKHVAFASMRNPASTSLTDRGASIDAQSLSRALGGCG